MSDVRAQRVGFIGLGEIGLPMARNLVEAGFSLKVFDLIEDRVEEVSRAGAQAAEDIADVVATCGVVITTLPSSEAFVSVAQEELLPACRQGQVFIECGTTIPYEIRRLAALFTNKGAVLVDAPVSGGSIGAQAGTLKIWPSGPKETVDYCLPLFEVLGDKQQIVYCGTSGQGQVMKGVNQLCMGLFSAVQLEIISFAVRSNLDLETVKKVFGDRLSHIDRVLQGNGNHVGVKFRELPYYIKEMQNMGSTMPLARALYEFCDKGERVVIDDHRPAPSFWHELLNTGIRE